jgi:hypothetical protein
MTSDVPDFVGVFTATREALRAKLPPSDRLVEGILSFHQWTDAQAAGSIFSSPLDTTSPQLHRKSGAGLASRFDRPIERAERKERPRQEARRP